MATEQYTPTIWTDGTTTIDADKLNNIEQGIFASRAQIDYLTNQLKINDAPRIEYAGQLAIAIPNTGGSVTKAALTFSKPKSDTNYAVLLEPSFKDNYHSANHPDRSPLVISNKTTTGFSVSIWHRDTGGLEIYKAYTIDNIQTIEGNNNYYYDRGSKFTNGIITKTASDLNTDTLVLACDFGNDDYYRVLSQGTDYTFAYDGTTLTITRVNNSASYADIVCEYLS